MDTPRKKVDCTPMWWSPPAFEDISAILQALKDIFEEDWLGFWVDIDGAGVWVIDRDGLLVSERQRKAKIRIGAFRQQQWLRMLHETGRYEQARALYLRKMLT